MTAPTTEAASAPDLAIRARPPSPKRLSRKVLMGGVALILSVIVAALVLGLSEPSPRSAREPEANASPVGPPDAIQNEAGSYEDFDFARPPRGEVSDDEVLTPPRDRLWTENSAPSAGNLAQQHAATADPEEVARLAPILFARPSANANAADGAQRLAARLTPPRSSYELLSGSIISAALVTELNSDLPGRVIAQVTAPVYDSVRGDHLLIPQGARLIGTYDNAVRYGDRRILLNWNRLILPNGWSIELEGMQGADSAGAAGVSDRVDQHLDRLAATIGLSAIVSVVANNAEDDEENSRLGENVADAAAQEAARTGGRIIEREMSVRPTVRVRAGAPVRVLVTRDIELRPYRAEAHAR